MRYPRYKITQGSNKRWNWRLIGANNEIICSGQSHGYGTYDIARRSIGSLKRVSLIAKIEKDRK